MIGFNDDELPNVMTAVELIKALLAIRSQINKNFQIWLSSDEEGNNFSPMHRDIKISIGIDGENKRLVFFPQD